MALPSGRERRALRDDPDLDALQGSGLQGCREGLLALYGYYRGTHRMLARVLRDVPDMPVLGPPNRTFVDFLRELKRRLLERLSPPLSREAFASLTLDHAIRFPTWQSFEEAGLSGDAKADLVAEWLK